MVSKERSSLADPSILNKIDKLFACNVGSHIALPQLVVVGDQSSGKSSVLEGLTGLPFPRDSGLCTRSATQITFRRTPVKSITVTIIPAKDASADHAAAVTSWEKQGLEDLDEETFAEIMVEAQRVMGVTDDESKTGTFSDDVLKLELCGPDRDHLSVVDVPGIFRGKTEGLTTKEDIDLVRRMVLSYMENPRSVMLAVIPSNVDIATQEILQMAEDVDSDGIRTLGILTKPDLVDKGAEGAVADLIQGNRHVLSLGWHMVRNPGQAEIKDRSTKNRDSAELAFFKSTAPWSSLDKDKIGIKSLQIRLQEILANHIKREFPKVRAELNKRLADCRTHLAKLGRHRDTSAEQSRYLLEFAMNFQELTSQALSTEYQGSDAFEQFPSLKIATLVRNRNELFAAMVTKFGHAFDFDDKEDSVLTTLLSMFTMKEQSKALELEGDQAAVRTVSNQPEVEEILLDIDSKIDPPKKQEMDAWLKGLYHNSRGFELGTFPASILPNSMKAQSKKWELLARGYVSDIICLVHRFIVDLLEEVCPDGRVRDALIPVLHDGLMTRYRKAMDHVDFLLHVERNELPTTLDTYFTNSVQESRQKRHDQLTEVKYTHEGHPISPPKFNPISIQEHTVQEIHDILKSYYEVARKRFIDSMCMQATGHFLVTGRETPLKLFCAGFVSDLTADQLEEIAGEGPATRRKRKQLAKEVAELKEGRKILY